MKIILLSILAIGFAWTAQADVLKVKSKDYTCAELNQLVQDEGTVHIKWIGSLDVHSSADACRGSKFGDPIVPYTTSWRTIDKFFCTAGYSCRVSSTDDDD